MRRLFFISIIFLTIQPVMLGQKLSMVIPDHIKTQFAGGIGFISIGAGYENKRETLEGDVYYGYLPKKIGGVTIHTASAKLTYLPFNSIDIKSFRYNFFSTGVTASYKFGKQYFLFDPDLYPYNYYAHPTALHLGIFVGGQVKKPVSEKNIKGIALYYELGTTDKELISYFTNSSLKINEILNLAVGLKTSF